MKFSELHTNTGTPSLIALAEWRRQLGISDTTAWRWTKAGWINPINISGRPYLRAEDILQFERRAAAGEFSKRPWGCTQKARGVA